MSPLVILIGCFFPSLHNRRIADGAAVGIEAAARDLGLGETYADPYWTYDRFLAAARGGGVDGGIVFANYWEVAFGTREIPSAGSLGIPLVDTSNRYEQPPLPRVVPDDEAIGRMAARLFAERRCSQALYVGFPDAFHFSRQRRAGFEAQCRASGIALLPPHPENWFGQGPRSPDGELKAWAAALPEKTGIFACNDEVGRLVWRVLRSAGRRVPEEILILGVDDEFSFASHGRARLSSIEPGGLACGRRAGRMLIEHLAGEAPLQTEVLSGFATLREGETTLPVKQTDGVVARALHYAGLSCADVRSWADLAGLNQRTMERHFQATLGCSPHDYLMRLKIDRAKELLLSTDLTMSQVAEESGFRSEKWFFEAFRNATGTTPGSFRRVS